MQAIAPVAKKFRKVYVEIGNVCNLQCSFCPEVEREKARLDRERFRKTLLEVKPFADRVCFHLMGEPLAHPDFVAFVGIAEEVGMPVEITTNGTLLSPEIEAALHSPIIHQVNFSLQSFFDNFPEASGSRYLEKILAFCVRTTRERPDLYLNLRLWNLGGDDSLNEDLLKKIEATFACPINRRVDPRLQKSKKLLGRLYLHFDTRFRWPNAKDPILRAMGTCHGLKSHVAIHADGTVVPCCLDKEAKIPLGNLGESSLQDILAGTRAEEVATGFARGELVADLCQRCEYSKRFKI